jgi:hypothetical protein
VGSGFRTFTAGEVLTASNVQNYLMDQSVMVFGGSAARSSAIGTANFEEGMVSYLEDTNLVEVYNGTNWASIAPVSTSGLTLINTTSFSGVTSASAPANTFSSTYTDYFIKCNLTLSNSTELFFRMRAAGTDATGSNYTYQYIYGVGVALAAATGTLTNGYLGVISASGRMVTETTIFNPNLAVNTFTNSKNTSSALAVATSGVNHTLATAYDSITILPGAGTITGDMAIYGLAK